MSGSSFVSVAPINAAEGPPLSPSLPQTFPNWQVGLRHITVTCCLAAVALALADAALSPRPASQVEALLPAHVRRAPSWVARHAASQSRLKRLAVSDSTTLEQATEPTTSSLIPATSWAPTSRFIQHQGTSTYFSIQNVAGAMGTIVFGVFFLQFMQDKLKGMAADKDADATAAPADAAMTLKAGEAQLLRLLKVKARTEPPPPAAGGISVRLETGASCMRQPGKGGSCSPQAWRGPEYADMDCGEDSFLLTPSLIGVADGVGAWRDEGVDPAFFANQMMANSKAIVEGPPQPVEGGEEFAQHPAMVMQQAYVKLVLNEEVEAGSATCCLAQLMPSGLLKVANLGDSCLVVIRDRKCIFHARTSQFSFNVPFQLEVPFNPENAMVFNAALETVQTQPGDGIVVATDGLFDNLFDQEIADIYETHKSAPPKEIARALREQALAVSQDKKKETPFSVLCKQVRYKWSGGKEDDISVVVARVVAA